jgi:hypothetical protein
VTVSAQSKWFGLAVAILAGALIRMAIQSLLEVPARTDYSSAYEKRIKRIAEPYWAAMGEKSTPTSRIEDIYTTELSLSMARRLAHVPSQALADWFEVLVHLCKKSSATCGTLAGAGVIGEKTFVLGLAHLPDEDIATWFRVPSMVSEGEIDLRTKAIVAHEIYAFLGALADLGGREALASRALLESQAVTSADRCLVLRAVLMEARRRSDETGLGWMRYVATTVLSREPVFY